MPTNEPLLPLPPDEPLYLEDDGEWHSFAELVGVLEPEFVPRDGNGLGLFLLCYDAWPAHEPGEAA